MRYLFVNLVFALIVIFSVNSCDNFTDSAGLNSADQYDEMLTIVNDMPLEDLDDAEIASLAFMREEEKLAHDVYVALFEKWGVRIFENISLSEQRHTEAIKLLLDKYSQEDPASVESGIFNNEDLQNLYTELVSLGDDSLIAALKVGAAIEEIDIIDIQQAIDDKINNEDITIVYENLKSGSGNHLRAFVRNLEMNGVDYIPQYLSADVYLSIISQ